MLKIVDVAKICHEANRELCLIQGDSSQRIWGEAPIWAKDSIIDGVKFHLDNPNAAPNQSHKNWLVHKAATGWGYGALKNEVTKEHPCMVLFEELPPEQQLKDHLFKGIVDAARPFMSGVE